MSERTIALLDAYVIKTYGTLQAGYLRLKAQQDGGQVCMDGVSYKKFTKYLKHLNKTPAVV